MTIRTQLKAGRAGSESNHNETLKVRTALKAGRAGASVQHNEALQVRSALKAGAVKVRSALKAGAMPNHNEALRVRSTIKAGRAGGGIQHNEALRRDPERRAITMRRLPRTTGRKEDRLELLVVRAGLRAGRAIRSAARMR